MRDGDGSEMLSGRVAPSVPASPFAESNPRSTAGPCTLTPTPALALTSASPPRARGRAGPAPATAWPRVLVAPWQLRHQLGQGRVYITRSRAQPLAPDTPGLYLCTHPTPTLAVRLSLQPPGFSLFTRLFRRSQIGPAPLIPRPNM